MAGRLKGSGKPRRTRQVRAGRLGPWRGQRKGGASTETWRGGRVLPVALHSFIPSFLPSFIHSWVCLHGLARDADHASACDLSLGGPLCGLSCPGIFRGLSYAPPAPSSRVEALTPDVIRGRGLGRRSGGGQVTRLGPRGGTRAPGSGGRGRALCLRPRPRERPWSLSRGERARHEPSLPPPWSRAAWAPDRD